MRDKASVSGEPVGALEGLQHEAEDVVDCEEAAGGGWGAGPVWRIGLVGGEMAGARGFMYRL